MKRTVIWVVVIVAVVLLIIMAGGKRDLSKYNELLNPKISEKPAQNMLVVEAKGDPNTVGKDAFSTLYKAFFAIKSKGAKNFTPSAPRARFQGIYGSNLGLAGKGEWVGRYALPIPEEVTEIPDVKPKAGILVKIEKWQYGTVAEILHAGSYATEETNILKLQKFIKDSGYTIAGDHEEEYLLGPESIFTKPEQYKTIIRYEVKEVKGKK